MIKLGGWARIGIVISILWSIMVFVSAATEYFEFSKEYQKNLELPAPPKGFVIVTKTKGMFFKWQPVDLLEKGSLSYVRNFNISGSRFFIMWLSPIMVLWILSLIIVFTFKWVKVGFSGGRSNGS